MYGQNSYMSEFEAKKMICEIGKRMYDRNYVAANDGNISIRVSKNTVICTPTGVSKGFMTPNMLVKINMKGEKIAGKLNPSSEIKMHLRVYEENENVRAVTHAHPLIATSYAVAGIELDLAILPEAVVLLGKVPIAPYATPGTMEVPDSIAPYCKDHNAVLLANHGALTWGKDITEAYHRLESLEHYASMMMYTTRILGAYNPLTCDQVDTLVKIRENMGINSGGQPTCVIPGGTSQIQADFVTSDSIKSHSSSADSKDEMIQSIVEKVTARITNLMQRK